jgi:hypothetical protein
MNARTTALICEFVKHATTPEIRRVYTALFDLAAKQAELNRPDPDASADVHDAVALEKERERYSEFMATQLIREDKVAAWKYWNTPTLFAAENPGLLAVIWQLLYFSDLAHKAVF